MINGQPVCDDGSFEYGTQNAQVVCRFGNKGQVLFGPVNLSENEINVMAKPMSINPRMLGYTSGHYTVESLFGQVSDVFGMDEVQCTGDEDYIWRCPHETMEDCSGDEGFGVICYDGGRKYFS